jgi:hypothetical protein
MQNRVVLENYYLPGDLERQIGAFIDYDNNQSSMLLTKEVMPALAQTLASA